MPSSLEKVLRFAEGTKAPQLSPPDDDLRLFVQAAHAALSEACASGDPAQAAELVYAAAELVESLAVSLSTDDLEDWVEATSAPDGTQVMLAGATAPYGDVPYADPGYIGGRKRYPIDEKHVKAAWSYINQAKNAARYTAVQLSAIKGRIKAAMKKHGHGVNIDATALVGLSGEPPILAQICDGEATVFLAAPPPGDIPMHHAPFTGTHEHAHSVTMTHGHPHSHQDDNSHGSPVHGSNANQKAWAAKGQSARPNW